LTEIWYEKIIMKRSLNSDGYQFHQHQQNVQSPLMEHKKYHDIWRWKPRPDLGQAQKCCVVKPVNGIPTFSSW